MKLDILDKEIDDSRLKEVKDLLSDAITENRDLSHLLRPSLLDELGLTPALRELVDNYKESTEIELMTSMELSEEIQAEEKKIIIYRAVQELLNNAVKHADPDRIEVDLTNKDSSIQLSVKDDGKGFDPDKVVKESGLGLKGIKENINIAGGEFKITSREGEGTRVQIVLPLD